MKVIKYLLTSIFGLLLVFSFSSTNSFALEVNDESVIPVDELDNSVIVDRVDYNSDFDFEKAVSNYLNDSNYLNITVIDSRSVGDIGLYSSKEYIESLETKKSIIQPQSVAIPMATNVVNIGNYQGSQLLETTWGEPGMNISLTMTKSASATLSGDWKFDKTAVGMGVGFSLTRSHSVSHTGTMPVPDTHNGKSVQRVKVNSYPVLQMYVFDYYVPKRDGLFGTKYVLLGQGTAGKPIGISFTRTYVYK